MSKCYKYNIISIEIFQESAQLFSLSDYWNVLFLKLKLRPCTKAKMYGKGVHHDLDYLYRDSISSFFDTKI